MWILLCESLLLYDASRRDWAVIPDINPDHLTPPQGTLNSLARWVAVEMTALAWPAYLLVCDGLLGCAACRKTPIVGWSTRARPNRFILACLSSIPIWCFFDWINFQFMNAWAYHGLPQSLLDRYIDYFVAFAAITPAMLLSAQLFQHTPMARWPGPRIQLSGAWDMVVVMIGMAGMAVPFIAQDPIGNLTLWVSLILMLDPINRRLGAPSILADWAAGRWGRTASLMAGGLICGFFWEFWNYWAIAKWTYRLPFLGPLESYRLFEMPLLGYLGFLPFAIECWVLLNFVIAATDRLGLRLCEPLVSDNDII